VETNGRFKNKSLLALGALVFVAYIFLVAVTIVVAHLLLTPAVRALHIAHDAPPFSGAAVMPWWASVLRIANSTAS
jgi:hypothetical protein